MSIVLWVSCAFGYYLINFEIKYMPGNLYVNVLMSTTAEICAKAAAYTQQSKLGIRRSYYAGLSVALIGCMMILGSEGKIESRLVLGLCLFVAKFGVAFTFMINYLSIVKLFPTLFCGTAAGICNFGGRLATIFAPLVAELSPPTPILILGGLLSAAFASSTLLLIQDNEAEIMKNKAKRMHQNLKKKL